MAEETARRTLNMCELCENSFKLDTLHHEKIRNIIHTIIENTGPIHISLFGSFARGEWHENSDLDLFIVAEDKDRCVSFLTEAGEAGSFAMEVEAFVHTPKEHQELLREKGPFITRVRTEGIVIWSGSE